MRKRTIFLAVAALALLTEPLFAMRYRLQSEFEMVPAPRLISPATEEVVLTGKGELEFKWSPHEGDSMRRAYYDFRLYEGYAMLDSSLILKRRTKSDEFSVTLKADMFRDGMVYTWSLRQVYTGSAKSDKVHQSFKVIKK
ncbi:MAG: hypothetical protein WC515_08680 [Candidatus Omnitrophota bacterium]